MIRFIKKIDLPTIYKIEKENFQNPWINKQFKVQLKKINAINIIIEQKNIIKGYIFGEIIDGSYHLYKISVQRKLMNQGIGTLLLDYLIKYLNDLNLLYIYLEVNASNIFAIKLYENYGFIKVNIRKNYYNNGTDAILYKMELK